MSTPKFFLIVIVWSITDLMQKTTSQKSCSYHECDHIGVDFLY